MLPKRLPINSGQRGRGRGFKGRKMVMSRFGGKKYLK
jgi:hypothetical protein